MAFIYSSKLFYILLAAFLNKAEGIDCGRYRSRLVRKLINQNFISQFYNHGYKVPIQCAFNTNRDIYLDNELHKETDNNDRWSCNYCGKTFVNENWLDQHFDNRHRDEVYQGQNAVCLEDHCDYLRCEVISGAKKPSYWEQALCKQEELDQLRQKCEATMKTCLPEDLTGMKRHDFLDKLKKSVCSSLTCEQYWENPIKQGSHTAVIYIVVTCVLAISLLLYYLVAYTHFYTDHSLLTDSDSLNQHDMTKKNELYHQQAPEGTVIRNRYAHTTGDT